MIFLKKQRVIKLKQGTCLKLCISLNTNYTAKANNDFQKNKNKFLNNSVFGKTIQKKRKKRDIWLVTNEKTRNRLAYALSFNGSKYISDFLHIFAMKEKDKVKMNSPIFIGVFVLHLIKILIYEFYHNHATPNGLNNC